MHVSTRHVLRQGPMLAMLGKTAARAFAQSMNKGKSAGAVVTPGPEFQRTFAPLADDLLDQYITHVGGDARAYRGLVPPHFFPHWAMPVASEALAALPYPILRVLNAGCRMQVNTLMPRNEPLHVRAQLSSIDDDGKRALITTRVITGTTSAPDALVTDIFAFVPLAHKSNGSNGKPAAPKPSAAKTEKPRVPEGSHEIAWIKLGAGAGLSFAKLTGDFNPIHWIAPYARASGFRNVILHGFGTFARACESLNRGLLGGDVRRLKLLDAKFTRPLVLPHAVGVYVRQREVTVGDGIQGPAYMTGHFETGEIR